jgi:ABC-2 type transport system ATP-binding protein
MVMVNRSAGGRRAGAGGHTVGRVYVISCQRLTKRFGATAAVRDLDLDVEAGQVYGFLGPNGAGKTTTIRMLLGLIAPSEGQIRLLGRPLPDPRVVSRTGAMIEEPAFYPWLTGLQNLQVIAATGGGCAVAEFSRVLEVTGLSEAAGRRVKTYSQGMRQRLGLAAAMLGRPPLLVIDEPTNGLDPAGIREIRGLLRDLAADGTTVFMSSHLLAEVEQVCDRVAVIVRGRMVEEGPPGGLGTIRRRVRVQVEPADIQTAARVLARWPAQLVGSEFMVEHNCGRDVNALLAAGGVVAESVTVELPRLEDRFLEIVEEENADALAAGG